MEKVKVLIADDNEIICRSIKNIISKIKNIEIVAIACNGEEEYNFIKKYEPDFLFSDVKMPKMNGIEVLEKLKEEKFKKIPETVFITGENFDIFKNTSIIENIHEIVNKPFSIEKIYNIMISYVTSQV